MNETILDYDRAFSAGHLASIMPGSLALDYNTSYESILQLRDEVKQLDSIRVHQSRESLRFEMGRASQKVVDFIGSIAHERDHVRRFLSSSYAFLCDSVRCQQVRVTAHAIGKLGPENYAKHNKTVHCMLMRESPSESTPNNIGDALCYNLRLLEQFLGAITDGMNGNPDASHFKSIHLGSTSPDDVYLACPVLLHNNRSLTRPLLNTRHILEMFAILEHGNGLSRKACATEDVQKLLDTMSGEYRQLMGVWNFAIGNGNVGKITSQQRSAGDLVFDWYRTFPFEFFVAADLALWPPYFPDQSVAIADPHSWQDISPASRFVRILERFEQTGLKPTPIPHESRNERFLQLQEELCAHFQWPTPTSLANAWLTKLTTALVTGQSPWLEIDGPSTYRLRNAYALLRLRCEKPADLVLNNIDYVQHKIERPPVWIFTEPDGSKRPLPIRRDEPTLLLPFIMIELTRHLSSGDRAAMSFQYDRKFREIAVSEYSSVLSQIGQWPGGLEDQFYDYLVKRVITAQDRIAEILRKT